MRNRYGWLIALLGVFALIAATAGNAGAAPKQSPDADVDVTLDEYGCGYNDEGTFVVWVAATAVAYADTQINYMNVSVREYRAVAAGVGNYYPFETTLDVADWYSFLDGHRNELTSPQSLSMRTDGDFESHHWNEVLTNGEPDPGSWFIVEAQADGRVNRQGRRGGENSWDYDRKAKFLQCETTPPVVFPEPELESPKSPWEDWNWDEP